MNRVLILFLILISYKDYSFCDNPNIEVYTNKGLLAIYNYNFKEAEKYINLLNKNFPDNISTYLLQSNYYWWKIISGENGDDNFTKCNTSLDKALSLIPLKTKKQLNNEELFHVITIYAFKARLEIIHKNHVQVVNYLNKIMNHLTYTFDKEESYPSFYLTSGLYNFFCEYSKEEYPFITPLMIVFPEGNKNKGLKQLVKTQQSSSILSNEAAYFLMKIYCEANIDFEKSLYYISFLTDRFPDNLFFQYYLFKAYLINDFDNEAEKQLTNIINLSNKNNEISLLQKHYYLKLGYYRLGKYYQDSINDYSKALFCYNKAAIYSVAKDEIYFNILLEKANLMNQTNKNQAIAMYNEIIKDSTDAKIKATAKRNLKLMEKNGIK